jgi:hypothetical protein
MVGANVEGYARANAAQRPSGAMSGIWYLMGKVTAFGLLIAFAASFLIIPWWIVIVQFVGAFILSLFFLSWVRNLGAAPGVSMLLMLIGAALVIFGLLNPEVATF